MPGKQTVGQRVAKGKGPHTRFRSGSMLTDPSGFGRALVFASKCRKTFTHRFAMLD